MLCGVACRKVDAPVNILVEAWIVEKAYVHSSRKSNIYHTDETSKRRMTSTKANNNPQTVQL